MHDRTKEIIDVLTWRPFNTPRLIRADTTVAHKILNLHAADTADINRTRRAAFKTAHPDSLTGSPGFTSDQGDLGRCLEEAKHLRGYIETATLAITLTAEVAWEPHRNPVYYPLPARSPPLVRASSPTGESDNRYTASCSTARVGPPSDYHQWWTPTRIAAGTPRSRNGTARSIERGHAHEEGARCSTRPLVAVPGGAAEAAATKHGPEQLTLWPARHRQPHGR